MSFETTLWTSVSGLTAAQRQMEVASHNLANVNTPGYSRQRAELVSSSPMPSATGARGDGMMGTGVTVADVVRLRNQLTDNAYWTESGNAAAADARSSILQRAESILGPVGGGVPDSLSKFWTSWDTLSLNPTDSGARQGVLDAGSELAGQIRSASAQLTRIQTDVGQSVGETVDTVNRLAQQAAQLNQSIQEAVNSGATPNDLMDKRDNVIDQLTQLTGGIVQNGDNGAKNVYVSNRPLVIDSDYEQMKATTGVPAGATWAVDGHAVTTGGKLGAYTELSNVTLPSIAGDLNNFANGLKTLINNAQQAGFDQDGNPGQALFTGTGAGDIAVNSSLTTRSVAAASTAAGAPVDGGNALNIAGLRTAAAVGANTLNQSIQGLAGRLGGLSQAAQNSASATKDVVDSISGQRAQESSVSSDEELANIVQYQHAYDASAKVIQVVDACLDTLVNLVQR